MHLVLLMPQHFLLTLPFDGASIAAYAAATPATLLFNANSNSKHLHIAASVPHTMHPSMATPQATAIDGESPPKTHKATAKAEKESAGHMHTSEGGVSQPQQS